MMRDMTKTRRQTADGTAVLRRFVAQYPTQKAAAAALGISQPYLSDILRGNRKLSDQMLEKLGLRRTVVADRQAS